MTRHFQFSLRVLLVAPALVGMLVATFWSEYQLMSRLMPFLACGLSAVMIVNGNRLVRAFGAGAIIPFVICAVMCIKEFFDVPTSFGSAKSIAVLVDANFEPFVRDYRFRVAFLWAAGTISGFVGTALTWLFSKP